MRRKGGDSVLKCRHASKLLLSYLDTELGKGCGKAPPKLVLDSILWAGGKDRTELQLLEVYPDLRHIKRRQKLYLSRTSIERTFSKLKKDEAGKPVNH